MNYNLQGKTWEGASDLLEVNWRLGNVRVRLDRLRHDTRPLVLQREAC